MGGIPQSSSLAELKTNKQIGEKGEIVPPPSPPPPPPPLPPPPPNQLTPHVCRIQTKTTALRDRPNPSHPPPLPPTPLTLRFCLHEKEFVPVAFLLANAGRLGLLL
ncbi:unnamed protein product [Mesocestoides corti]|uniref:WH2 domain-containing protein n=1 Tax=Mesocestoides corti TaxID=53468 RepID=A0A0R3U8Z0_MESCO|nr:unnamed protein product [Mesocestoides corti]